MVRTRHSRHAPLPSPVRCRDGHIMITPWPDPVWETFARFVGNTEWAEDERYREGANRWLRGDEVNRDVGEWAARYDKDDLFQQLQENGVPAAPVNTAEDIARSPQMEARGFFSKVDHPEAGNLSDPTAGYLFSETPLLLRRRAPLLGEHNRLVYIGRLGRRVYQFRHPGTVGKHTLGLMAASMSGAESGQPRERRAVTIPLHDTGIPV
ncbi:MAG: CoA transferase [Gammaproteobacteria bacterium]